jgi:hypothetical protein
MANEPKIRRLASEIGVKSERRADYIGDDCSRALRKLPSPDNWNANTSPLSHTRSDRCESAQLAPCVRR